METQLPKIKETERSRKRRTPQLGDDLFYNVAIPYRYEKPMPQHFHEKPKPPSLLLGFFLPHSLNIWNREFKEQELELKLKQQQQQTNASLV